MAENVTIEAAAADYGLSLAVLEIADGLHVVAAGAVEALEMLIATVRAGESISGEDLETIASALPRARQNLLANGADRAAIRARILEATR